MEKAVGRKEFGMIRIAVTGPESTGKSWLTRQLAAHFDTVWTPEYAREYLEESGGRYQFDDLLVMAREQYRREELLSVQHPEILFCDTEFSVLYIWSEVKFGRVDPWISGMLQNHRYDLYLLCNTEIPWEYDPLREHPEMREWLFHRYVSLLEEHNLPYRVVGNLGEDRLRNALDNINEALPELKNPG